MQNGPGGAVQANGLDKMEESMRKSSIGDLQLWRNENVPIHLLSCYVTNMDSLMWLWRALVSHWDQPSNNPCSPVNSKTSICTEFGSDWNVSLTKQRNLDIN